MINDYKEWKKSMERREVYDRLFNNQPLPENLKLLGMRDLSHEDIVRDLGPVVCSGECAVKQTYKRVCTIPVILPPDDERQCDIRLTKITQICLDCSCDLQKPDICANVTIQVSTIADSSCAFWEERITGENLAWAMKMGSNIGNSQWSFNGFPVEGTCAGVNDVHVYDY